MLPEADVSQAIRLSLPCGNQQCNTSADIQDPIKTTMRYQALRGQEFFNLSSNFVFTGVPQCEMKYTHNL